MSREIKHHDLRQCLPEEWWIEAGMQGFKPSACSYRVNEAKGGAVFLVDVNDVAPLRRTLSHGLFGDKDGGPPVRQRVVQILQGFVRGEAIPPVEILPALEGSEHRYRLKDGAHRFYLSIAAGFTHVPAVEGFDYKNWSG